jgi:hypothetical protein
VTQQQRRTMLGDISLHVGERGLALGMTRTGKSTLATQIIETWRLEYPKATTLIIDTKPRYKAEYELNGMKAMWRYRSWDWGEFVPGSVTLRLGPDIRSEIHLAQSLGYKVIIAQTAKRAEYPLLTHAMQCCFEDRKRNSQLFVYVDELGGLVRNIPRQYVGTIVSVITGGGEKSVGFLGAAQRPRWIPIEAMESMTKLYWFKTPFGEDVKHLANMGVPRTAKPPKAYYTFYFFDRLSERQGYFRLSLRPNVKGTRQ